eukprot:4833153-Pyramimonas_sp.AAC.1
MAPGDFNARLFQQQPGEDDTVGRYVFENKWPQRRDNLNGNILVEACRATNSVVANTFFEHGANQLVTHHSPDGNVTEDAHAK